MRSITGRNERWPRLIWPTLYMVEVPRDGGRMHACT